MSSSQNVQVLVEGMFWTWVFFFLRVGLKTHSSLWLHWTQPESFCSRARLVFGAFNSLLSIYDARLITQWITTEFLLFGMITGFPGSPTCFSSRSPHSGSIFLALRTYQMLSSDFGISLSTDIHGNLSEKWNLVGLNWFYFYSLGRSCLLWGGEPQGHNWFLVVGSMEESAEDLVD